MGREQSATHSLVKALRAVPGFAAVDDRTLLRVVGDSANLVWRAGSTVFARGSAADGLYVILSGSVRILGPDDKEEVNVLRDGDFFGEFSLLLDTEHRNTVAATEDTEIMVVPKETFQQLLDSSPDLGRQVRETLEARLAMLTPQAIELHP